VFGRLRPPYLVAASRYVNASSACPVAALASFFFPSSIAALRIFPFDHDRRTIMKARHPLVGCADDDRGGKHCFGAFRWIAPAFPKAGEG
jgi:hypothetical protein